VKTISPLTVPSPTQKEKFKRELRSLLSDLGHAGIRFALEEVIARSHLLEQDYSDAIDALSAKK